MAQVTVTIDGKAYRMACEEGQEGHLTELAIRFDNYVIHLKDQFGEIGDLRLTVMAGIMITDELSELQRKVQSLQSELDALKNNRESAMAANARSEEAVAAALVDVSSRLRGLTEKLTARPGASVN